MIINASDIPPMESMTALQILQAVGYDPESKKVKRAAEYLELWREKSVEAAIDEEKSQPSKDRI
jgi:hypothetical protein